MCEFCMNSYVAGVYNNVALPSLLPASSFSSTLPHRGYTMRLASVRCFLLTCSMLWVNTSAKDDAWLLA